VVFLYGPPGVGKYSVAVELAARSGFRLLHNHLTVNLVSTVFERDSDVWLRMLRKVRRDMLTEAAHHNVNLILTGVFNGTLETSTPGAPCWSQSRPTAARSCSSS
jgi:broad-specificity NMP kinase